MPVGDSTIDIPSRNMRIVKMEDINLPTSEISQSQEERLKVLADLLLEILCEKEIKIEELSDDTDRD